MQALAVQVIEQIQRHDIVAVREVCQSLSATDLQALLHVRQKVKKLSVFV